MLKKVLFYISYLPEHELGSRVFMELWLHGIEAQRMPVEAQRIPVEAVVKETLIVTDLPGLALEYRKKGYAVLGYLHDKNKEASFSGVTYLTEDFSGIDTSYCRMVHARAHNQPLDILETKRCIVREMIPEDVDRLYEIYAQPGITDYVEPLFEDKQKEAAYIADYIEHVYAFFGYGMWVVIDKESGMLIGRAGLEPKENRIELGYVIDTEWQSRGYAYEVCKAILDYAWEILAMKQVWARVHRDNYRSVKLCRKLGFICVKSGKNDWEEEIFLARSDRI